MPNVNINRRTTIGSQKRKPFSFGNVVQYLSGIVGNEMVDISGNGYNADVINKDFTINGIPYKSTALIAQKAVNFGIIPDPYNFWYTTGGTPNQIPVVSLYQNVDYANIIFCRHVNQSVDSNLIETNEPFVVEIVTYSVALTGSNLINANAYFSVPTEDLAAYWVDFVNGNDTTGTGTKLLPWKTIKKGINSSASGSKIYARSAEYTETRTFDFLWIDTIRHIEGVGFVKLKSTSSADYIVQMTAAATGSLKGIYFTYVSENYILSINSSGTIERCFISGGDIGTCITVNSATTPTIKNCVIVASLRAFASLYNGNIDTCYIKTTSSSTNITIDGGSTTTFLNSKIRTLSSGSLISHTVGSACVIKGSKFYIDANITELYTTTSATSSLSFTYSLITSQYNFTNSVITAPKTTIFNDNRVVLTYAFVSKMLVDFKNGLTIECYRNIITSTTTGGLNSFAVYQTTGAPVTTSVKFYYNKVFTKSESSYVFRIGTENTSAYDGTISGIEILGNYIEYTGTSMGTTHAIFVGHNINALIRYNYVINLEYHTVYKHSAQINTSGDVSYNISKNAQILCFGAQNYRVYGNVVYMDKSANTGGIVVSSNGGGDPTGSDIKNNIIEAKDTSSIYILESTKSGVVLDFDYNVLYAEDGVEVFAIDGAYKTKAEWLATSQDLNSVFINPILDSELIPQSPINIAENLGATYDDGLDVSTDWGNTSEVPVIVLKQQSSAWQCGAYIK